MAKEKRQPPATAPDTDGLRVFPHELRAGDLVTVDEREWQVVGHPAGYRQGKMVEVRLQKPEDPSVVSAQHWGAHERVAVRR